MAGDRILARAGAMRLEPVGSDDPRDVLRALRGAVLGAGPAIAVGVSAPRDGAAVGHPSSERAALPTDVPSGTAVVITTSGSTGLPKRVALSRNALTTSALATTARVGDGVWLLALPAVYVAGLQVLVRSLISGREPAILSGSFRPDLFAAAALSMASSERGQRVPTYTSLVPAQAQRLLDAAEHDSDVLRALRSFERILVGGQSLPLALRERAETAGVRLVRTYGSTETSGGCVYDGVPLDGVRLRIRDTEVQVASPALADGYLDDPEQTDAAFPRDPDGTRWYRTGDAGEFDAGVLTIHGRRDNVIISGGVNVSLDRVERVVRSIRGLETSAVVGVPDERWGEASVVLALTADVGDLPEEVLLDRARDAVATELGQPARPARLVVVDAIPHLPSGKPDRVALQRLASST